MRSWPGQGSGLEIYLKPYALRTTLPPSSSGPSKTGMDIATICGRPIAIRVNVRWVIGAISVGIVRMIIDEWTVVIGVMPITPSMGGSWRQQARARDRSHGYTAARQQGPHDVLSRIHPGTTERSSIVFHSITSICSSTAINDQNMVAK